MADFAAAQPQRPQLPAGWQPNLQRIISDIVPMLSAEQRQACREFMKGMKAKRDAREIPSLSAALMEQAPSVVGPELWQLCIDRQRMGTLSIACQMGQVDAVRLLLDQGAEVDRANQNGATPLSAAEINGHSSIVALFEEHLDSKYPLHTAARSGDVAAMTQLLDGGAEVDAKKDGATPLFVACQGGHVDTARLLLG